jgi:hypothetical protein
MMSNPQPVEVRYIMQVSTSRPPIERRRALGLG